MDRINIKNLEVHANHGVLPEERIFGQKFLISVALYTDLRAAGKTDKLEKTLDYGSVCSDIESFVQNNSFNLIETVAEELAEKLLLENPALQKVWVEIKKPEAPVNVQLETVSVEIVRSRHIAYIALGSNMGDREENLSMAINELDKAKGCSVLDVSPFINTKPYGYMEQEDFLNGCLALETVLTPHELLDLLRETENKAGRVRAERWGPRTLDLDIIYYDDIIMSDETLRIPHAEAHKRDFVLKPIGEIAPYKLHPVLNKTAAELLEELGVRS